MTAFAFYERQILAAIEALSPSFPARLSWMGDRIAVAQSDTDDAGSLLIEQLTSLLYSQFYCYGHATPLPVAEPERAAMATDRFINDLRLANHEQPRWTPGWKIIDKSRGVVHVLRNGLHMSVADPDQIRAITSEDDVEVRFPAASLSASPGFFVVQSGEPLSIRSSVRLYWNTSSTAATVLVERFTKLFRRSRTRYQLKVLISLAQSERADSSVLYLERDDLKRFARSFNRIYQEVQHSMRAATPAFTLRLAPGLALAEGPPDGESFGRSRCRLVAEALVQLSRSGRQIGKAGLEAVACHFASKGLSMSRPYLAAGSKYEYSSPVSAGIKSPSPRSQESSDRNAFLDTAVSIGDYLTQSAIWSDNRCNWLGLLTGTRAGYGALGPALYSGTSGIGWFLAELYRASQDSRFKRTALAALQHSCRAIESNKHKYGNGLYSGAAGVAYAAWRCGILLNNQDLLDHAVRIFNRAQNSPGVSSSDVISGEAGVILALAACEQSGTRIERLGQALLASAVQRSGTLSWKTVNAGRSPNLTGFSHGTAGIASALWILFAKTKQPVFRDSAEKALRYERACFNETEGNWPDYRSAHNRRSPASYTVAWCHGAPGIALSRALAIKVCDTDDGYGRDLAAALQTTRTAVAHAAPGVDLCLCHGIAGNADVLQLVGGTECRKLVEQAASSNIARSNPFSAGTLAQKSSGLMTGWAGVGHFYLRVVDQSVPSPLWIGPEFSSLKKVA
jgi:hypothetical protein